MTKTVTFSLKHDRHLARLIRVDFTFASTISDDEAITQARNMLPVTNDRIVSAEITHQEIKAFTQY